MPSCSKCEEGYYLPNDNQELSCKSTCLSCSLQLINQIYKKVILPKKKNKFEGCSYKCESCELEYDTCLSCSSDLRDLSENCACIKGYYELASSLTYTC